MNPDPSTREFSQSVIVIRHGDRKDNFEPLWIKSADRRWDPPLFDDGFTRASNQGTKIKSAYPFSISRVFVSPFLRCAQTASRLIPALADPDSSPVKVAVEFGLCEVLNFHCIRPESVPKDGKFEFDIAEIEKVLAVKLDTGVNSVYEKMPEWGETREEARMRYVKVIEELANRYCDENLLLVTHGEAVGVACAEYLEGVDVVYHVDYCGYVHLTRNVVVNETGKLVDATKFKVGENEGQTGVEYTIRSNIFCSQDHF